MRSAFLAAAFVLLLAQSGAYAQPKRTYGVKLGIVGANETWTMISSADLGTSTRWGFTAEVFAEIPLFRYLSAVGEIQYTQKGMRYSAPVTTISQPDGTGEYYTMRPRIDYISVPMLARLRIPLHAVTPYLLVGPRFDFLISSRADGLDAVVSRFDRMDYGLTLGAGVELDSIFPFGLLAEFRYNPNVYDSYESSYLSVRNRSLDFLIGVRL